LEVPLVLEGVLHGQDAAPGIPQQVKITGIEPERLADLLDFLHHTIHRPEGAVFGLVAVKRAQLVVFYHLEALPGKEAFKTFHIFVGHGGTAVEQEYLDPRVVADALGPDAEVPDGGMDGDQPDPGGLD